jgi:hypothetical protein
MAQAGLIFDSKLRHFNQELRQVHPKIAASSGECVMKALWFTVHEQGGFDVERAALGSYDLSVLHIAGEWQWLVRQDGRDMREGAAPSADDAKLEAEAVAVKLLDPTP